MICVGVQIGCTPWQNRRPLFARSDTPKNEAPLPMTDDEQAVENQPMHAQRETESDADSPSESESEAVTEASHASAPGVRPAVAVVGLSFDVIRVELPLAESSIATDIWKYVDESNSDPSLPALLARNGMRIGVADGSAWAAMRSIFERNSARSSRDQLTMQEDQPAMIRMGKLEEGGMYFLHRRGGKVEGGTFEAGDRFIRLDYEMPASDTDAIDLRVTLETRGADSTRRLVSHDGKVQQVLATEGDSFGEMAYSTRLENGQFLVMGSGDSADKGFRIGSWWFRSQSGENRTETIVCVRPAPFRVE